MPELVLPAGASVQFDLTSRDVVHSFFITGFRFKRDMFPGQVQSFQVDIGERTGSWPDAGICAEFCGLDHHKMRFDVRIVPPDEFAEWAAEACGASVTPLDRTRRSPSPSVDDFSLRRRRRRRPAAHARRAG